MRPLTVKTFTFNPFGTNTYVVSDGAEAMIIDASADTTPAYEAVTTYAQEQQLRVTHLVLTHAHIDHVFGMDAWARAFSLRWHAHPESLRMLEMIPMQSSLFGVPLSPPSSPQHLISHGMPLSALGRTFTVLHVPGHSPDSIALYTAGHCFVGDALFHEAIGRTDLPGGEAETLYASIQQHLYALPADTIVYPGHGPTTTIGHEAKHNPFVRA